MGKLYALYVRKYSTNWANAVQKIDFPAFLESLKAADSQTALSPSRLAGVLELPLQDLASLARVHRNTVQSAPNSPKLQSAMRDVLRVLSAAQQHHGDLNKALFWFRNFPIPQFGHATPIELVAQGKAQLLIEHLEATGASRT